MLEYLEKIALRRAQRYIKENNDVKQQIEQILPILISKEQSAHTHDLIDR